MPNQVSRKNWLKQYKKYYTNILYVEYTRDLHQSVIDMDFTDDLPEDCEKERFRKHNRFLRSLKDDTLLIIDNFNMTATQDSFLSVVLKYRCRVLFTTRSKFDGHCILQLKEIQEPSSLFQLASSFYSEAEEHRTLVEEIIQTVHRHTFAVELAAKLLENGILSPKQLLEKLREEKASLENEDKINAIKLEKEALAQIKETTDGNAHLVSNLHANLGGLYRINGQAEFAKGHMEKGIFIYDSFALQK